jgi:MGT family glycosyltransferase
MARFLFAAWSFPGDIYPSIAVACALRTCGHEVAFYTGRQGRAVAVGEGFRCFPFDHIDEERLYDIMFSRSYFLSPWKRPTQLIRVLREWLIETVPQQIEDLETVMSTWTPDVIVCAPSMWGPILVIHEARRAPVAVLCYYPGCMIPGPDVPLYGLGLPRPRNVFTRLLARAVRTAVDLVLASSRRAADVLRERYALSPITTPVAEFAGRMPLYLVTSAPELDYERRDLPSSVHYVGPCLWNKPPEERSEDLLGELPRGQPWVHVSEGTVHVGEPFVLRAAAQGLAKSPVQVIMTTGGNRDPAELDVGSRAANVHVVRWVSHSELLPRTDVLVTTGGAGTVLAALNVGVPMVVIPTEWDKLGNAQRVVEAGAGLRLAPRGCTAERLRAAVERVLGEPSFRRNAQRIAASFAHHGGPAEAAELLEQLANGQL